MKNFTLSLLILFAVISAQGQPKDKYPSVRSFTQQTEESAINQLIARMTELTQLNHHHMMKSDYLIRKAAATLKLDSIVITGLETGSGKWINESKEEFIYDTNYRPVEMHEKVWDTQSGKWSLSSKINMVYSPAGRISDMIISAVDPDDDLLKQESKITYFYGQGGSVDSVYNYTAAENQSWALSAKIYFRYDTNGRITKYEIVTFDEEDKIWMKLGENRYTYNAGGQRTESAIYVYLFIDPMLFMKTLYTYNTAGRLTAEETSALNLQNFQFEKTTKSEYTYNENGDQEVYTDYTWSAADAKWVEDYKTEFLYDNNISFSEAVFPYLTSLDIYDIELAPTVFSKLMIGDNGSDFIDGKFVLNSKSKYYYSGMIPSGIFETSLNEALVYPNPAQNMVRFFWPGNSTQLQLELYTITGIRVMDKAILTGSQVNISNLTAGTYFYKLLGNGETVFNGKIVKR
jgi:hypothetical protein